MLVANLLKVFAVLGVLIWGWYVRTRFFQVAARSKPLRITVLVVNGFCIVFLISMMLWRLFLR